MRSKQSEDSPSQEPHKVDLKGKFAQFSEHWSPRQVGRLNDCQITLAKGKGQFVWHSHEDTDELFLVVEGEMTLEFRDRKVHLKPGDMCVVPRGVEHRPDCPVECHVLVIDREGTVNTGDASSRLTVRQYPQI